jgi:CHAT domain-containing protein
MAAGDFLDAVAEQDGIDVVVELFDPRGRLVLAVDSPDNWAWEEELAWVAEEPGAYRLSVQPLDKSAPPGRYRIRTDGPRPARAEDRTRARAVLAMRAALDEIGNPEAYVQHLDEALALWRELGDRRRQAETLHQTGDALGKINRYEEAAERFEQAAALWRELDVAGRQAWSLAFARYYQGRFYLKPDPRTAFGYLSQALPLARQAGSQELEMRIAYHLGYVCDDLAEKQDAIQYYEETLEIARRLQATGYEIDSLNGLGLVYFSLGHQEKAIELCQQAVDLSRAKASAREAAAINNLALIYEQHDPARAHELYMRTLALGGETHDVELQAVALNNLAFLEVRTGDPAKALELSRRALALGVKSREVSIRQAMGVSLRKLNDLEASRRELETALVLSRERQDRVRESLIIPELARTARRAGDIAGALDRLRSGIQIVESLRIKVVEEELRATFLASRLDIYALYTETLMALHRSEPGGGHDAEALRASEQARARSLLDILTEAGADIRDGADPGGLQRENRGPRYAALTQPEPLSVAGIQSGLLDGRALLLEYALGEEKSFLWAVTPDGLRSFELPPRAAIEDAARRYYAALTAHPATSAGKTAGDEMRQAADELSAMLLRPVEDLLTGQPLLVVSDGALQYIPFAPLPTPSSLDRPERIPLIAEHEIVSLPSASALAVLRRELAGRPAAPKTLAVFADPVFQRTDERFRVHAHGGDALTRLTPPHRGLPEGPRDGEIDPRKLPRLRFSEKEADAIAALVPEPQRFKALGFAASRAAATGGELAHYRMVHFATHGLIDSRRPELSSLVLSLVDENGQPQNGFLRLHDIYNLKLNADLVVLSACQTALGQEIRGEGLVGLTRGFMYAGAARVMSSLWSVDDRATSELMKRFYTHMISGGLSPAAALRRAQVEMSSEPRWSAPYYWAGFSLQGEWR